MSGRASARVDRQTKPNLMKWSVIALIAVLNILADLKRAWNMNALAVKNDAYGPG